MRRHTAFGLFSVCAVLFAIGTPWAIYAARERQFRRIQQAVADCGASLDWELVDGNYSLHMRGESLAGESISPLVKNLKELPTDSTLLGPGESRRFWISIEDSPATDSALAELCELPIAWLAVSGGRISDATVARICEQRNLNGILLSKVEISALAIAKLDQALPKSSLMIDGEWIK